MIHFHPVVTEQTLTPRDPATKIATWAEVERWRTEIDGIGWRSPTACSICCTRGTSICSWPRARTAGDALVVGVNSDDSVRRLKGPTRPVRSAAERRLRPRRARDVSTTSSSSRRTRRSSWSSALEPDVIVKGGDYTEATIVGANEVKSWGGRVVVVPLTPGQSTTAIIERTAVEQK